MKSAQGQIHPFYGERAAGIRGWRRFVLGVVPLHTYVPLRSELHFLKLRLRRRGVAEQYRSSKHLLVNVGAGNNGKPGWVNVDAWPGKMVDCVFDCRKRLPFADESVAAIFTEHFFEHLDYTEEIPAFVADCWRVLEPGGVLRVIVPDAEAYVRAYTEPGWNRMSELRMLGDERNDPYLGGRYQTKMQLLNAVFRQGHEHKYAYDYETLALVLHQHGFSDVRRQTFGQSVRAELAIDDAARAAESLYVDALKGSEAGAL